MRSLATILLFLKNQFFSYSRLRDYEGYLSVPFFPAHLRNTQYAIRAFNVELASIRESVSKPEIGKMRMQFWKDTIDKVYAVSNTKDREKKKLMANYNRDILLNNQLLWLYLKH